MHTKIVGIINITPDSFSDGGSCISVSDALQQLDTLIHSGIHVLDIGAESTRPNATTLSAKQEWQRLDGVLEPLISKCKKHNILVSLDTRHSENAAKAIELGVSWINDVTGANDPEMIRLVSQANQSIRLVVMHHLGVPVDKKKTIAPHLDPVDVVLNWAKQKIASLAVAGIKKERIIIDPGIGFGKTANQSWALIRNVEQLRTLGVDVLVGHSRKSFLTDLCGDDFQARDAGTLAVSLYLASKSVEYIRIHNAQSHQYALPVANHLWRQ
jgi:dihydropteroate synthase